MDHKISLILSLPENQWTLNGIRLCTCWHRNWPLTMKAGTTPFSVLPVYPHWETLRSKIFCEAAWRLWTIRPGWFAKGNWDVAWQEQDWHCQLSETTARAETQLALRQEDIGERKQRLIRDDKGIAILSLSRTKRGQEKATEYRNSQRPGYNTTACCHRIQNLK